MHSCSSTTCTRSSSWMNGYNWREILIRFSNAVGPTLYLHHRLGRGTNILNQPRLNFIMLSILINTFHPNNSQAIVFISYTQYILLSIKSHSYNFWPLFLRYWKTMDVVVEMIEWGWLLVTFVWIWRLFSLLLDCWGGYWVESVRFLGHLITLLVYCYMAVLAGYQKTVREYKKLGAVEEKLSEPVFDILFHLVVL